MLRGRRKDRLKFGEYCLIVEGYGRGHVDVWVQRRLPPWRLTICLWFGWGSDQVAVEKVKLGWAVCIHDFDLAFIL
jgi:hypothetical protein